jgi:sigma54-dependent transcription regulator
MAVVVIQQSRRRVGRYFSIHSARNIVLKTFSSIVLPEVVISKYPSRAVIWERIQFLSVKIKSRDPVAYVKYKIIHTRAKNFMFNTNVEKYLSYINDGSNKLLQST